MTSLRSVLTDALAYEAAQFDATDTDLDVSGADLVDWFSQWRQTAREALAVNQISFLLPADPYEALAILCEMRDALDERAIKLRKQQRPMPLGDAVAVILGDKADKLETAARQVHASVLAILSAMGRNVIKGA